MKVCARVKYEVELEPIEFYILGRALMGRLRPHDLPKAEILFNQMMACRKPIPVEEKSD